MAVTDHFDPGHSRRMDGQRTLHTFVGDDATDRHRLIHALALNLEHHAVEYLNTFLGTFDDPQVGINRVTYAELGDIGFELRLFDGLYDQVHGRPLIRATKHPFQGQTQWRATQDNGEYDNCQVPGRPHSVCWITEKSPLPLRKPLLDQTLRLKIQPRRATPATLTRYTTVMRTAAHTLRTLALLALLAVVAACTDAGDAKAATATTQPSGDSNMVRVHVFNREGKLVGPVDSPKVIKTDAQWKEQLGNETYLIVRNKGTEAPFCGNLLDNHKEGVYACVACGLPLFSSKAKFQSGTGWPSFFQPIAPGNVTESRDTSHGMVRTESLCARCGAHLGHVFDDGPRPTGLRFCMNSASLRFVDEKDLKTLADPILDATGTAIGATTQPTTQPSARSQSQAVFAGGCFWCTEAAFEQVKGVSDVESGYAGGSQETANYEAVSRGNTGHAEAIRITYDPQVISYDELLEIFFEAHDPTTRNRQGNDIGTQYRSAIFYADEYEKLAAEKAIREGNKQRKPSRQIVTTVEPLTAFYPAETYHQDYARRNPDQPYIEYTSKPHVEAIKEKFPDKTK